MSQFTVNEAMRENVTTGPSTGTPTLNGQAIHALCSVAARKRVVPTGTAAA